MDFMYNLRQRLDLGFFCPVCVNLIEEVAVTLYIPFIFLTVHKRLLSE